MLQIDGAAYRTDRDRRETMQRFFRHGRLVLLEGVGHVPHLEASDEFNRQVERFLAEIGFR
jgi:pimeloyl-ACP methyl ester carboxylesterase